MSAGLHPPAQHISECWNSAEFFANKLLKDFRGVDDRQVAWAKQLKVGGYLQAARAHGCASGCRLPACLAQCATCNCVTCKTTNCLLDLIDSGLFSDQVHHAQDNQLCF